MANKKTVGTVAELFAGVGGFRIGLEKAGFDTVFSNQWEPSTKTQHASSVYVANFGNKGHSNEDIQIVVDRISEGKSKEIPKVDLVVGGFPCQDYSVAKSLNSSKGLEGKKGVLWWSIYKLVAHHKPKYVFLENVDRLLKSPASLRGRDFAIMLRTLGDLGYTIEWRLMNAAEEGFPQRRIRVFIIATRNELAKFSKTKPEDYIFKTGILARAFKYSAETDISSFKLDEDPTNITKNFNKSGKSSPFLDSGVYRDANVWTVKTKSDYKGARATLRDVLVDSSRVPKEYWIDNDRLHEWEYLKGAKSIARTHKESGVEYFYSEGKMAFPDSLDKPSRTILTGEGGTTPSRFKHIIKVGTRYRRLLPMELERLNGFPDNWTAVGELGEEISDIRRAFFMGNALVVGLIEKVGKVIAADLKKS
ncbi:MAG: DNA (cytosine-5-)-methyltransferase [Acidobacteria bacterium]|nr:DNA (cytosine-5-)-methyltransferase [Acidobacteriota bacterium]